LNQIKCFIYPLVFLHKKPFCYCEAAEKVLLP
jgi:hypothetical protein